MTMRKPNYAETVRELRVIIENRQRRLGNLKEALPTATSKDRKWMEKEIAEHEKWLPKAIADVKRFYAPAIH